MAVVVQQADTRHIDTSPSHCDQYAWPSTVILGVLMGGRAGRVALISSSYHPYPGGVEEHTRQVARELRERGVAVEVWTVDRGEHLGVRQVDDITVHYLPTPLPAATPGAILRFARDLGPAWRLWRHAYQGFRPDVVHVQCFGPNGLYALALARLTGVPLIVSSHGETFADEHNAFDTSWLLRSGLRRALRGAAQATACSEVVLDDLRTRFGLRGGMVVPNGVDLAEAERLGVVPPARSGDRPPVVAAVGRLVPVKGFDLLVRAFAEADVPPGTRLVIGGDGQQLEPLRLLAGELGVNTIELPGRLDRRQVLELMGEADVVAIPSRREAFGIVLLEAWRAGAAVLATDRDGPGSLVRHGVDGLSIDPQDTASFARELNTLLTDAELRGRLGHAGQQRVRQFSWQQVAQNYLSLYRRTTSPASKENHMREGEQTATVAVVTYRRPDHVRTCLEHLSLQTLAPTQTLVIDSSPDDLTAAVVAQFPTVTYLRNERGRGHTATSRAIAMSRAIGDVVAFIDDDAYAEPDWLEELVKRFEPGVGAVGGRALNGQPGEDIEGIGSIGLLLPNGQLTGFFAADPDRDLEIDHAIGCNMAVRRDVVEHLGGIHDHFPGTCLREESDIALRMRKAGYRLVFTPDARVFHVGGTYAKGHRFDLRYDYYAARNHIVLLTHALGWSDTHTRSHLQAVPLRALRGVMAGLRGGLDGQRQPKARGRAVAGGLARAGVLVAGTTVGLGASAWITLAERGLPHKPH